MRIVWGNIYPTKTRWTRGFTLLKIQKKNLFCALTVESFEIEPESGRLFLKVEVKSERGPDFDFTRVYERVAEASAEAGAALQE